MSNERCPYGNFSFRTKCDCVFCQRDNLGVKLTAANQRIVELEKRLAQVKHLDDLIAKNTQTTELKQRCQALAAHAVLDEQETEGLKERLQEAVGLLLLSHGRLRIKNENDLADKIHAFLAPSPPPETDTCSGLLELSGDKTHWTCDNCGKTFPMGVTPVEATKNEPEYVMVRRSDLEKVEPIVRNHADLLTQDSYKSHTEIGTVLTEVANRLEAALEKAKP